MGEAEAQTATRKRARVTIAGDAMSATLILFRPTDGDAPITLDEVREEIKNVGVMYGIDEDAVVKLVDSQEYNNPVTIAQGKRPTRGINAEFEHHFDTGHKCTPTEDPEGRIDYKDLNYIQNTEKGAVLVTKTPPTPGVPGMTVRGKEIKGPDGRDLPFKRGVNTEVSEDGLTLTATASGAIVFQYGKVSVNDLLIIKGDVDHTVGNLDCRGSVRISGDVKAGYKLTIDGDLEIGGHVEDATIEVKGNIHVQGGFFGKGDGIMKAGGDITVKYVEGQRMIAGGNIFVGGEIINGNILARNCIELKGRHSKIVGGEAKAGKEIRASVLGSGAGTQTHLFVAFNVETMRQYKHVTGELERLNADKDRVKAALYGLYKLQMAGKLPPDKEQALKQLEKFNKDLPHTLRALAEQKEKLEEKLREYNDAVIIAEKIMHTGVVAHFGIVYRQILEDHEKCRLIVDDGKIMLAEFTPGPE